MKKIYLLVPFALLVILLLIIFNKKPLQNNLNDSNNKVSQPTEISKTEVIPSPQNNEVTNNKIIPNDNLCSQISKEFVTNITGIPIARMGTINDFSITACDYYLTEEKNSPYIVIVLNKNLKVEVQKTYALRQKLVISTDPRIGTDHYIVTAPKEGRIVNINLILNPENFIRIDKNVERAIDNEGLMKLAIAFSKRLWFN